MWVWWGCMEFNISSTALLPFPTCKDFSVITLLDSEAGQRVGLKPSLPFLRAECELKTWWYSSEPLRVGGGALLRVPVVFSAGLPSEVRGSRGPGPWEYSPGSLPDKLVFSLHLLPLTDWLSLYSTLGGSSCSNSKARHVTHRFRMPADLLATDLRSPVGMQEVNHLRALDSCV